MTNLERIQKMNAKELSELLVAIADHCYNLAEEDDGECAGCPIFNPNRQCTAKNIASYLNEEAPKKTYTVTIQEKVRQDFEVMATNADEALQIAMDKYRNGEFVLEPGELQYKEIAISKPDDEETEFEYF